MVVEGGVARCGGEEEEAHTLGLTREDAWNQGRRAHDVLVCDNGTGYVKGEWIALRLSNGAFGSERKLTLG